MTLDWLKQCCDPKGSPLLRHPWDWQGNAFATNGAVLVVLDGAGIGLPILDGERALPVEKIFARPARPLGQTTAEAILAWAQEGTAPQEGPCAICDGTGLVLCQECHGEGTVACFHCDSEIECEGCDGKGQAPCATCLPYPERHHHAPKRPGLLWGKPIDRNLLALILPHLAGPCTATLLQAEVDAVLLSGAGWRVALCQMTSAPESSPAFEG